MVKLLRPLNHTLMDVCLANLNSDTEREQFRLFIHYLILKNYYSRTLNMPLNIVGDKKHLDVEIFISFLNSRIFNSKTSTDIISKAMSSGSIIVNTYCVGKFPKRYRVNYSCLKNLVENYEYTFKYETNQSKFEKLFKGDKGKYSKIILDENEKVQMEFISQLKLDEELFYNELENLLTDKRERNELGIYYLNYCSILEYECRMFDILKDYSYYDNFSGRYYNFFTNKKSVIRKCFKVNGYRLISLDIKSSQLYFFTQLPNINLNNFIVDKSRILIDDDFKNEVLNGDIYNFFADKLKLTRAVVKEKILSYMYGDKRLKNIANVFRSYFPRTFDTLQYLKTISIDNVKFCFTEIHKRSGVSIKKNNYFNYILQSVEREMFLASLEGMNGFYTIHDSVYFQEGREEDFKAKISNYFAVNNLDVPRLCME